jgi:hypothetical protein
MADWDAVQAEHRAAGLAVETELRHRWEDVFDKLDGAGIEPPSGRGNEVLLDLAQWEQVARIVRRAQTHGLLRGSSDARRN